MAALVKDDFVSIGLRDYGVEIHLDDLSKKEILSYIDAVNFNTKTFLKQDYINFKKYISAERYPAHIDYLHNDYAPDLIKFMQSKINGRKNASYLVFLKAVGEENLPVFSARQEAFIRYASEMLPLVRPYEYLIMQKLLFQAGSCAMAEIKRHAESSIPDYLQPAFDHALRYMLETGYFRLRDGTLSLADIELNGEFEQYMTDLLDYGLSRFAIDFCEAAPGETFRLWAKYRKEQIQLLLLNNPKDIMLGTKIHNGTVYAYVTVIKSGSVKEGLKYADGYIDADTFQWETVANVSEKQLAELKNSRGIRIFVRKVENEDGIQLPFTYIGRGRMEYIEGSQKANGAHLFRVPMNVKAPEDIYFDFKLPE